VQPIGYKKLPRNNRQKSTLPYVLLYSLDCVEHLSFAFDAKIDIVDLV